MKSTCVAILLLAATAAQAQRLEVGVGSSIAVIHGDGVWYQRAFPHDLDTRAPAFKVGLTGDISPRLSWHLDAVHLGRNSVNSRSTPHDENYIKGVGYNGTALPLANYIGTGKVYGFAATLEAHTTGDTQYGVEAGPFIYRSKWRMSVPDWYPAQQTGPSTFVAAGPVAPVWADQAQWALGGVVGLTARKGPVGLSLRVYLDGKGFKGHGSDPWPPIWKRHIVLMATYRF